jgi:hypothetical protein
VEALELRLNPSNVSVLSFHNDPGLTGANLQETVLTPSNVNSTNFGKLATVTTDGYAYASTLYVANLSINGTLHNVAYVSTEHDSVYAFDIVNNPSSPTGVTISTLWQRSFITGGPGGPTTAGITSVPNADVGTGDIVPEIGITGSPVIDATTGTLYVIAKTKEVRADGAHYVQTLHALDITTGADKYITSGNGGYVIGDSKGDGFANQTTAIVVAGGGADSSIANDRVNGRVAFNAFRENERSSLMLLNGRVYVAWASHGDNGPYHGWVVGFNETTLQPEKWFNTSPNTRAAGIWQSQGAISTDGTFLYCVTGNAFGGNPDPGFDPAHGNYGETALKLDPSGPGTAITVASYFTPNEWLSLDNSDADFGSGGLMLLPAAVGSTAHPNLGVAVGKSGKIYLLDTTPGHDMGGNVPAGQTDQVVQTITAGPGGVWGTPAFYQDGPNTGIIYYHGSGVDTRAFRITNGVITPASAAYDSNQTFGFPGAQPIISANGAQNGSTAIDWELQVDNYGSQGLATLHAYVADPATGNVLTELYNSNQVGQRDQLTASVKFTSATETNGWVLVAQGGGAAAGNPASGSFNVFGLFPTATAAPGAPTNLTGQGASPTSIQLNWTNPSPNTATLIKIFRSPGDNQHYTQVNSVAGTATSYTDTGLTQGQTYFYKIQAANSAGSSAFSNEIQTNPTIAPPVLTADNVTSVKVSLSWTRPAAANDHYSVERSTTANFATFTTVASNIPGSQTSYDDTDPILVSQPGQYYYRIRAFTSPAETLFAVSNVVGVKVGPNSGIINYPPPNGFPLPPATPIDLTANGSAAFAETTARLTNANNQTGSVFSTNEENILNWNTTFQVRLHEGTQPFYANGFAFVIQAISPTALGQGLQGLGYQGILNSLAIKFDTNTNSPENGTGGSTGIFFNGDRPTTPSQPGEVNIMLDSTMVNLMSQSTKTITLSYAYNAANPGSSVLHETISDPDHPSGTFTHDYTVDLPSLLGLPVNGNSIGWVGFTASTGSSNWWELQDILNWVYTPVGPAAPHGLTASASSNANDLSWKATSADEEGYFIERSTDPNSGFTRIGQTAAGVTTFHDDNGGAGLTNPMQYFYRVQAFNHAGPGGSELDSGYSNIASSNVVNIPFGSGFPNANNLTLNGGAALNGTALRLTDAGGSEARSAFFNTIVGTGAFTTTFVLRDQPQSGSADSVSFVMQANPAGLTAVGGNGGGGGYSGMNNSIAIKFDLYSGGTHTPTTGLYMNGQNPGQAPGGQSIALGTGINLGQPGQSGNPLQVTLSYDGTGMLTETVVDTVTKAMFTHTYTINISQTIGANRAYVGFTGGTGGETAIQEILTWSGQFQVAPPPAPPSPQLGIWSLLPGQVDLYWNFIPEADAGFRLQRSSDNGQTYQTIVTIPAGGAPYYQDTGLLPQTYLYRVVALASNGQTSTSNVVSANLTTTAEGVVIDHSGGFASHNDIATNGGATFVGTSLRLTDGGGSEARSAFEKAPVATGAFTTTFTLQDTPVSGSADSASFVIQNDPRGLTALGGGGGAGGYGGITNSIAIKFDLYTHGTHNPSTGLFVNGQAPDQFPAQDVAITGLSLGSGHPILVTLTYDGSTTLVETLRDTVTGATFSHTYTNSTTLAQVIGGPQAYVGFTGGTGGETAIQDILNWTYSFTTTVNFANGFAGSTGTPTLVTRGNASINGTALRLTDGGGGEASAAYYVTQVGTGNFTTTFTLRDQPVTGAADSVSFVMQNDPRGTGALGAGGGGGGYAGITNSFAIKFDLYDHGDHNPSTGLFTGGADPSGNPSLDVPLTGINLGSGDMFQVTLTYNGTTLHEVVTDLTTPGTPFTHDYALNLAQVIGGGTAYVGFTGGTGGETAIQDILSWTGSFQPSGSVNFGNGFANTTSTGPLAINGNASINGTALRVTDGGGGQASSAFYRTPVPVETFTTTFTLKDQPVSGAADSMSFVLQADPRGTAALGGGGGSGGYGPGNQINNSIAIKFDLYSGGTHTPTTGLYMNGQSPGGAPGGQSIAITGINLGSGNPIQVTLTYDGTILHETVTDTVTHVTFNQDYTVNIVQTIGSFTAFAGFTGGTGGETAIQDVLSWTGTFQGSAATPAAPTNLLADPYSNPGSVRLYWQEFSTIEQGFAIERATSASGPFTQIATVDALSISYTDNPSPGTYFYRVRALGPNGTFSGYSNTAMAVVLVPEAPSYLSGSQVSSSEIDLQWSNNSFVQTGFRIERSVGDQSHFVTVGTVDAFTTTFKDTTIQAAGTYYYRVFATNAYGDSLPSNVATVTLSLVPSAPSNLQATPASPTEVDLQWTNNPPALATGIRIERSLGDQSHFTMLATVGPTATTYQDHTVTAPNTYFYRVFAFNSFGDSPASNVAQATVQLAGQPVLYYRFDEASGTTALDSSGNNNTGTLSGDAMHVQGLPGFGNGLHFNGTGYVMANDSSSLDPTSQITVSAWINADTWANGNHRILQKSTDDSDNQYRLLVEGGALKFDITGLGTAQTTTLPSTGAWHNVTGTYDGSTIKLYVDGSLVASQAASGQIPVTNGPLFVATKNAGAPAGDHFVGTIDEVRIYARALTQAQIQLLPFTDTDIGSVQAAGSASVSSGSVGGGNATFSVIGSGDDIWNNADAFNFAYQPLNGNAVITAKVTGLTPTDQWAKAAVMFRNSLDAGSAFVDLVVTPNQTSGFVTAPLSEASLQWRDTLNGAPGSIDLGTGSAPIPYWIRLTRNGNVFTAQTSADGVNWTTVGTHTTTMNTQNFVGLGVTAHNNGQLSTGVFTNVSVVDGPEGAWPVLAPWSPDTASTSGAPLDASFASAAPSVSGENAAPTLAPVVSSVATAVVPSTSGAKGSTLVVGALNAPTGSGLAGNQLPASLPQESLTVASAPVIAATLASPNTLAGDVADDVLAATQQDVPTDALDQVFAAGLDEALQG